MINEKTNAVAFGDYGIVLMKEQLYYYSKGDLMRVRDVNHEFTFDDLMNLAKKISDKNHYGVPYFCQKSDIVKK